MQRPVCELGHKWAGPGSRAVGLEGKNSWELRVGWRAGLGRIYRGSWVLVRIFSRGWRKWDLPLKHHV